WPDGRDGRDGRTREGRPTVRPSDRQTVRTGAARRSRPPSARRARAPGPRRHRKGRRACRRAVSRERNRVDRLTRLAGAVVVLLTVGCRERAQAVQGEAELKDMVHRMMPAVAQTTGLKFKSQPLVLRRSREQVRDYLIHKFDEDLPPAELAGLQSSLRLFGLLPGSFDLRSIMIDVLTEQVAGYYDPDSNALYIPADIEPFQLRIVVSHELVHALQDQYVRLDSIITQRHAND